MSEGDLPMPGDEDLELEVLDALPVLSEPRQLAAPVAAPAVQVAAAAATGFLAGAVTLALLRRRGVRRLARDLGELRELKDRLEPVRRSSDPFAMAPGHSYLVHVRVLGRPPE
jgi:hypothetical protein